MYLPKCKKMKFHTGDADYSLPDYGNGKSRTPAEVIDYSDVFALSKLLAGLDDGKYGSVTKEYETLHAQRMEVINLLSSLRPSLASSCASPGLKSSQAGLACSDQSSGRNQVNPDQHIDRSISHVVIDLDVDPSADISVNNDPENKEGKDSTAVIILDSDEEDGGNQVGIKHSPTSELKACNTPAWLDPQLQLLCQRQAKLSAQEGNSNQLVPYEQGYGGLNCDVAMEGRRLPSIKFEKAVLRNVTEKQPIQCEKIALKNEIDKQLSRDEKVVLQYQTDKQPIQGLLNLNYGVGGREREGEELHNEVNVDKESVLSSSLISFVGMQAQSPGMESHNKEDKEISENDGLEDLWKDMSLALECSKGAISSDASPYVQNGEDCEHSYILEDDLGLVCRICGVIQKSIETIFDFQWKKGTRTTRTYMSGSRHSKDVDEDFLCYGPKILDHRFIAADISVHPRHMKKMRPHQIEGFNFLVRNLLADKPGGCILAHAPGSGKTFMLISFIQSFLARDPDARPLVVLPKGILTTWKKEFQRWQVEDIPLNDFYSSNAINRTQQLEVLRNWEESRSILFLGYKQFANIVSGGVTDKISAACQERLLKVPSLLILDEGHTPRNENTDVLSSLAKVQTPCKVVLSGTLFQNHVREVFNILNLVRPKFLKMESSRAVVKRVLSRVNISGRRPYKGCQESSFYDLVEETLQNDENYKRKITVIQDLRELTQNILHYYKGDFLEELPGLVDFTVLLKLSAKQKEIVQNLGKFEKFKRSSVGSAVYIHPHLMDISKHAAGDRGSAFTDDKIDGMIDSMDIRDGVKTKFFLNILSMCESAGEKLLVFSQYLPPLKFLERLVVRTKGWRSGKEIFMISGDSSPEQRELSMEQFNSSPDAKVFFGSIKACGEGISLVGASRVVILDIHLNPSVTRQAIGRAFRPGQQKKVYTYRLVASDSPEEEDHKTSFRKELIAKMWFEWSEYCGHDHFELDPVDVSNSQDMFLENPVLGEDIKALYRRNLSSLSQRGHFGI